MDKNKEKLLKYIRQLEPSKQKYIQHDENAKTEKRHMQALQKIADNPAIIKINPQVKTYTEILTKDKYGTNGEIDVILTNPTTCYIIEYKCTNSIKNKNKAKKQLLRAKQFLPKEHKRDITKLLYISENFKTKELKENIWKNFNE